MKVGYVTWGKFSGAKDNAILVLPATNAPKAWASYHIGAGRTFDTDKYFVIGVDPVGSGTSSQPKDGLGVNFVDAVNATITLEPGVQERKL